MKLSYKHHNNNKQKSSVDIETQNYYMRSLHRVQRDLDKMHDFFNDFSEKNFLGVISESSEKSSSTLDPKKIKNQKEQFQNTLIEETEQLTTQCQTDKHLSSSFKGRQELLENSLKQVMITQKTNYENGNITETESNDFKTVLILNLTPKFIKNMLIYQEQHDEKRTI